MLAHRWPRFSKAECEGSDRRHQGRHKGDFERRHAWIDLPGNDLSAGGAERRQYAEKRPGVQIAGIGLDYQQHAAEAYRDRAPAPPAHLLLEDAYGEDRHQERRHLKDRVKLRELHVDDGGSERQDVYAIKQAAREHCTGNQSG